MHSNLESDCSTTMNMNCKTALGFVRPHGSDMVLQLMTFIRPSTYVRYYKCWREYLDMRLNRYSLFLKPLSIFFVGITSRTSFGGGGGGGGGGAFAPPCQNLCPPPPPPCEHCMKCENKTSDAPQAF